MNKSIEDIWKEGFLKSDALVAPKLNDLYNQKSMHIIDNLMSIGRKNIVGIIVGALVLLALSIIFKTVPAGIVLFLILISLAYYTQKLRNRMNGIDQGMNTYEYIKTLDRWLKDRIASLTKMYRVLYPVIVFAFSIGLWHSKFGRIVMEHTSLGDPGTFMLWSVPGYWLLGTVIWAGLISILAGPLYRLDIHIVYGRIFDKLEEMIKEMEELRA
ncbi:MAG: hypothetical protein P8Z37_19005 [Acidobacteriota bacterium]|jgi:F0F1-type ATP synthase assembly protein I